MIIRRTVVSEGFGMGEMCFPDDGSDYKILSFLPKLWRCAFGGPDVSVIQCPSHDLPVAKNKMYFASLCVGRGD